MKYNIHHIAAAALLLLMAACSQDKDLGNAMTEEQLINEISLNSGNSIELAVGMTENVIATYSTENIKYPNLTWTSGNANVASADNDGNITGQSVGNTTVTIRQEGNLGSLAQLSVRVKPVATAISLGDISIYEGSKVKLVANLTPNNAYSELNWTIANNSVATISGDSLQALVPGETTITATTTDGSNLTATANLTVKRIVPVTGIELESCGYDLNIGDQGRITCTLIPADATADLLEWKSSDENIATVDGNGVVTGVGYGNATITATAASGVSQSIVVTVGEGTINQDFSNGLGKWYLGQSGSSYVSGGTCTTITMQSGSKWRGDFNLGSSKNPVTLNVGTYRYLAIKMTRPGEYRLNNNGAGTVLLDTSHGRYQQKQGNGNNRYSILGYEGKEADAPMDEPVVTYYDLQQEFGTSGNGYFYSTTATEGGLTTFKILVADIPTTYSQSYKIYWVHAFKTLEEMQAFAAKH